MLPVSEYLAGQAVKGAGAQEFEANSILSIPVENNTSIFRYFIWK